MRWMFSVAERALTLPALLGRNEHHDEGDCPKAGRHINDDIHLYVKLFHLGFPSESNRPGARRLRSSVIAGCTRSLLLREAGEHVGMCRHIGSGSRPCRHAFMLPVASAHEASCIMPLRSMWMECLTALHAGGRKKAARRRLVKLLEIIDLLFDGAASSALVSVFALGVLDGLPLHVPRPVWATGAQGDDVVHHVAWARMARFRRPRGRAGSHSHKFRA